MLDKTKLFILTTTVFVASCGSLLDISGRGAKTNCLTLSTNKLSIDCNCAEKQIKSIAIYRNKSLKENFGTKIHDILIEPTVNSFPLPINKDSSNLCFFQIEIHLTNSHHREAYYIVTKPGDFLKAKKIYARYFSH
jgi:hypothetical protein